MQVGVELSAPYIFGEKMQRPFNEEQHEVLSRSFDATNNAINHLNDNFNKLRYSLNIHALILGIVIAIIMGQINDRLTMFILWFLLILDLGFMMVILRR